MTTTISDFYPAPTDTGRHHREGDELLAHYHELQASDCVTWAAQYRKIRLLGKGGQGVVYLSERQGTDLFRLPVALKIFSPESYRDASSYLDDMSRIADIAARVAQIQHDNLLDLHNFIEQGGIRIMVMEWVDGYDLRDLLTHRTFERTQALLGHDLWRHVNEVVICEGTYQPRFKPGVAIQVLRDCLAALAALHREGIVHGDLKPANIMVKRTGNAKIIDIGSAMDLGQAARRRMWTPTYAAPEVLRGGPSTAQSDLASLGYVLIEMLAGQCPFEGLHDYRTLLEAKSELDRRLKEMLPAEVSCNELLLHLCQKLTASDPARRFPSAQAAEFDRKGAADFHRQLIKGDLASEYENDLRIWLEELN
jgi:eukaryotic-like serine/threonine-protein kinase